MPSSAGQTCALRSEEHTSELQSHSHLVSRLLLAPNHQPLTLQQHQELALSIFPRPPRCPASSRGRSSSSSLWWCRCDAQAPGFRTFFFLRKGGRPVSAPFPPPPLSG